MRCGWCFTPNAEVQTPDGKTKIENLSIGDEVLTIKESKLSTTTVTNKFVRQVSKDDVVRVVVGSNKVFVTKEHPFYVKDKGWVHAGELQVGDIIISATSSQLNSYRMKHSNPKFNGKTVKSVSSLSQKQIIRLEGKKSNTVTVVNLETEDHTFLCYGCLVHNCDTPFTSWYNEFENVDVEDLYEKMINEYGWVKHVVITGGEPTMQKDLSDLIDLLKENNHYITIETNGTIFKSSIRPHLFSISPKLSNSIPSKTNCPKGDYNIEKAADKHTATMLKLNSNLEKYIRLDDEGEIGIQIKFVVQGEDDLREIEDMVDTLSIPNELIYLMPEGFTKELQLQRSEQIAEICEEKKWIFCPRLQINLWGNKRGV